MKSAWYNENELPEQMLQGINGGLGWPTLEDSWHFKYLKGAIDVCTGSINMCDLGCGGGEVGRCFKDLDYTGYDLPHIIEKVAKIVNNNLNFIDFDAYLTDFKFCENYDIILSNSFITELESPMNILEKVLNNSKKYVILHRQKFTKIEESKVYNTYANLETIESTISEVDFNNMISTKYKVIYNESYNEMRTITLMKK